MFLCHRTDQGKFIKIICYIFKYRRVTTIYNEMHLFLH